MDSNPNTSVNEPVQSTSLEDSLAGGGTAPAPSLSPIPSTSSNPPGTKPVRPPKAAQRPSTASRRSSMAAAGTTEKRTDTSEGTTLAGGSDMASVEKMEDAAPQASLGGPDAVVATSSTTVPTRDASQNAVPTTDSAVDTRGPSAGAATGITQPAATNTAPTNTSQSTTSSRTNSSPTAAPPPPAPAPSASRKAPGSVKKKRKGPFTFLLACLPCVGATGHEDESTGLPKRPSTAARILEKEQEKRNTASVNASGSGSDEKDAVTMDPKEAEQEANEKAALSPVQPETTITPTQTEPLTTAATPADTPVATPPPTSSPSQRGVVLSQEETEGVTSGAVVPPGQAAPHPPTPTPRSKRRKSGKRGVAATDGIITSVPEPGMVAGGIVVAGAEETSSEDVSDEDEEDVSDEEEEEDEEAGLIARGGVGIPIGEDGLPHPLLEELAADMQGRKCLVLDLDETLVHSSFKMVHQADYVVPVEIENQFHNVYVIKRPGVDAFLQAMGDIYEIVVFTASLSKYADPVLDQLDVHRVVKHRLFRESCYNNKGNYVKDLSQLGRPIGDCIIIDNSPASYVFHPNNAVPISSWFNDPHDTELTDLIPFLSDLSAVEDIRSVLDANLYPPQPAEATAGTASQFQQL
ncbi:hypothetical protein Rt10032_c11g4454 [Rhodotorula toruloides]|uniref:FCP1 homology domain-containing protein n=1 Tax=Rhodotorula toruloides TaxID=5286 RepID=A0A511KJ72_RHOTO|nr:hypothetical protein Rt10032_c11g4454 [Rhodotorula toruloides]